ncbi:hypothetical protein Slin15195_G029780 [Septoria linicola]|uniref:Uncharacterized protein n=1 Tax=Septoria linicola TaxID=215465 RepID=A0A9Q9AKK7_9PEZI|nr:hypothetical protein Slin14017_G028810 [Septoria linicola]USW49659.1 hypothetical protein Slin15195_G029780 [Septoria linicola]
MDQIKKVFSPGSTKDDELMYGSEQSRLQNVADNEAKKDSSTLYPTDGQAGQEKESGGVLRQIVNPGGKKYDEQALGTTATTERPGQTEGLADSRTGAQAAQDQSGAHGAGRDVGTASVVNRAHDNDPNKGDTILASTGTTSSSRPLGDSNLTSGSSLGHGQPSTSSTSGALAGTNSSRTGGITDPSDQTFSSGQTGSESHLGRDAGITGGLAAAGAGAGAYGARSHNESNLSSTAGASTSQPLVERSHPLTSGTTHGHINPVGGPEASLRETGGQSGPEPHVGSAHSGALGSSQHNTGIAPGGVHNNEGTTQLNQAPTDVQGATFLDRSFYIGKPGDSVSHGPHVPGEFPVESTTIGTSSTTGASSIQTPTNTTQYGSPSAQQTSTSSDHTTRNAALAGGVLGAGALGTGAYAASRDHPSATTGQSGISQTAAPTSGLSQPTSTSGATQDPAFSHYGRDSSIPTTSGLGSRDISAPTTSGLGSRDTSAPVASGLGSRDTSAPVASGLGSRDTSAPVTSGLGSSSVTQPTNTTTTTTHGSVTPRSDVAQTGVPATAHDLKQDTTREDHHYGRDAAVVGGVGAAGAGAYAATRDHAEPGSTTHDAYGTDDPNKHNKLHKQSPDDKKLEKEHIKEEKHHQKELDKQQHEAQKQHEKDAKERQHAAEKAEKKHEKELEKQHEKEEKDKKPSLIDRILHRHKDDDEKETKYNKDEKSGEPLHIKENTNNGPLDHPLVTATGASTAAAAGSGAGVAGASHQTSHQHGTGATSSSEPLHLKDNSERGPLDHPLITAAGTSTAAGVGGASAYQAGHQHGTGSDLSGQRQRNVEPHLSGHNDTIGSSNTTTSAATAGGLGATSGAAGTQVTPAAYQQGRHNTSDLTGQRQRDVEPQLSGNNNAIGSSGAGAGTSAAVAGGALAAGGVAGTQHHQGGGSNVVNEPRTGLPMDLNKGTGAGGTDGNPRIEGYQSQSGASTTGSGIAGSGIAGPGITGSSTTGSGTTGSGLTGSGLTGSGLTGRRQDDVDPYITPSSKN